MPLPLVHALSRVLQLPCSSSEAASFFRLRAFSAVRFKRLACCVLCGWLSQPMSPWSGVRVLTVQSGLSLRRTALSLPHLKSPLSSLREPPPSLRDLGKPQLGSWGYDGKELSLILGLFRLGCLFFPLCICLYCCCGLSWMRSTDDWKSHLHAGEGTRHSGARDCESQWRGVDTSPASCLHTLPSISGYLAVLFSVPGG